MLIRILLVLMRSCFCPPNSALPLFTSKTEDRDAPQPIYTVSMPSWSDLAYATSTISSSKLAILSNA